jgi:hypothetical protein
VPLVAAARVVPLVAVDALAVVRLVGRASLVARALPVGAQAPVERAGLRVAPGLVARAVRLARAQAQVVLPVPPW